MPADRLRKYQGTFAGTKTEALVWLRGLVAAGVTHFCLRFVGEHDENIPLAAEMRAALNA